MKRSDFCSDCSQLRSFIIHSGSYLFLHHYFDVPVVIHHVFLVVLSLGMLATTTWGTVGQINPAVLAVELRHWVIRDQIITIGYNTRIAVFRWASNLKSKRNPWRGRSEWRPSIFTMKILGWCTVFTQAVCHSTTIQPMYFRHYEDLYQDNWGFSLPR